MWPVLVKAKVLCLSRAPLPSPERGSKVALISSDSPKMYYPARKRSQGLFEEKNPPQASTAGVRRTPPGVVCPSAGGTPCKARGRQWVTPTRPQPVTEPEVWGNHHTLIPESRGVPPAWTKPSHQEKRLDAQDQSREAAAPGPAVERDPVSNLAAVRTRAAQPTAQQPRGFAGVPACQAPNRTPRAYGRGGRSCWRPGGCCRTRFCLRSPFLSIPAILLVGMLLSHPLTTV